MILAAVLLASCGNTPQGATPKTEAGFAEIERGEVPPALQYVRAVKG